MYNNQVPQHPCAFSMKKISNKGFLKSICMKKASQNMINILCNQNTIFLFIISFTCWSNLCSHRKCALYVLDFYKFGMVFSLFYNVLISKNVLQTPTSFFFYKLYLVVEGAVKWSQNFRIHWAL